MVRSILSLFAILFIVTGHAQQGFTVRAKIKNPKNYTIGIGYMVNNKYIIDTSYRKENGWAVFTGRVEEPVIANFFVRKNPALLISTGRGVIPGPGLTFFLSNDLIKIKGEADHIYEAGVEGGQANKEWNRIRKEQNKLTRQNWLALKKAYEETKPGDDSVLFKRSGELSEANGLKENQLRNDFMKKYPNSIVSMYFLAGMVNSLSLEELKAAYAKMGDQIKSSAYGVRIDEKIRSSEATAIGRNAVPIDKKDINGDRVNLQTLKGKYVLLDFWGSWCGPCRKSHPHLKELYAKYKDKGFEILGIAQEQREKLDDNQKVWKDAIQQDGLPWLQVLNNEEADRFDAVKAYGVSAFPTKILLDKEGKIIARYVGDEESFDKKLKELFGF